MIVYHGSSSKITKFEIRNNTGYDQYGPGIYFTDKMTTARGYGRNVHAVDLDITRFIKPKAAIIRSKIVAMAKKADRDTLSNWSENRNEALKMLTESLLNTDDMQDAMTSVWRDVFNLDNKKTCLEFVRQNIDGFIIQMTGEKFYTVFNPRTITIRDEEQ